MLFMSSVRVMDIAFLLNYNEGNHLPTSHQPQFGASTGALEQCYLSGYLFHRLSPAIRPVATRAVHTLGISHITVVRDSLCRIHSRSGN
ncbi:hypothetical protein BDV33DRAFT_186183 [Aspergillus novoparasiticus]|uniref:Uncharacterized protein n=1 Tax=Aspergillus novoparasiticus TaxID=986946 RepID=A0A5N6E7F1_9EURO|nr:hypothetical protein BDV33DRAFT_186183 [Aspergillus novoparasiticus]